MKYKQAYYEEKRKREVAEGLLKTLVTIIKEKEAHDEQ